MIHRVTPEPTRALAGILAACALASAASAAPSAQADGKLAIRAGRIVTLAGPDIENGVVVIEAGRITAIGADVEVPWDVPVVDGSDLVAFPGFVEAFSSSGMDRANENVDVAPFLSIRDSLDPVNLYFENALRWGITTINVQHGDQCVIGARGMVVKPHGMTVEEMLVEPDSGLTICVSPKRGKSSATQAQALRDTFNGLRLYLEELVAAAREGKDTARREALFQGRDLEGENAKGRAMEGSAWTVAGLEIVPRGEIDEKQAPLLQLVEGKLDAFVLCGAPRDVARGVEIARENGFLEHTVFVVDNSCWKAAAELAAAGRPVVLTGSLVHSERDFMTGEEVETFVPAVFEEHGVRYALSSLSATTESLWYQAALAVGEGLSREKALAAVTTVPADALGLSGRVGTLEVGKDGNVVLFSGDPLSITTWVQHVVLEGKHVYDRSTDQRLRQLLEGTQPPGTIMAETPGEGPAHEDGEDADDDEERP